MGETPHVNVIRSAAVLAASGSLLLTGCTAAQADKPAARSSVSASSASADNGVAALPAARILARAQEAIAAAKSFPLSGEMPGHLSGIKVGNGTPVAFDLKVSGENSLGRITVSGNEIQMLVAGDRTYFRVTEKTLAAVVGPAQAHRLAPRLAGSWIEPRQRYPLFEAIERAFDRDHLVMLEGTLTTGKRGSVRGRPAIVLSGEGGVSASLLVSTVGEPLPLVLIYPGAPRGGRLEFTEYGEAFTGLDSPAGGEVIAIPQE
jgi:hypothetical protein